MPIDPRSVVRSSNMLWGDQVAIIDAMDAMDTVRLGPEGLEYLASRRRPVIYPFNRNGLPGFIAPINPYA
jgi:hypothetical protein